MTALSVKGAVWILNVKMRKRKILIATLYNSMNAGARLQAYALYKYLSNLGYDAEFYKGGARKPLKRTVIHALRALKQGSVSSFYNLIIGYLRIQSLQFAVPVVSVSKARKKFDEYSALICGSDEIWNLKRNQIRAYPYLTGQGIRIDKKIAYAASTGNADPDDLKKVQWFETELRKFSAISVREEHSVKWIEEISGKEVTHVLDPVFLIDWSSLCKSRPVQCVFIYAYHDLSEDTELKAKVTELARKNQLKIVTMGDVDCNWADKSIPMNSEAFLYYLSNSRLVVTNTFHGTAFSVVLKRNFIALESSSEKKLKSLLHYLRLENRCVDMNADFEDLFVKSVDYGPVDEILQEARNRSEQYIIHSLQEDC